ncbi:hypothetical protein GQ55_4G037500 [Panicum hallii var. hallii]|uniref:[RNA-polymerase]-subunit kinase n=1 Tax=Panicum hallii var. hallii TaxID=1504633 RepID=A0A2T7DUY9_9POAL|nr:hypothetical protein GQ55_4G037500 [Panicum hallii var. hallii]
MHTPVDQELHADCSSRGVLHRSNLLIHRHGGLKIGDSTLANAYYYGLGCCRPLTSCWGSADYGFGIDVWSARCLLAEMFLGKPLPRATTEFFSTPPLPCVVDEDEEVADPAASHDGRKPKQRQRSQRRKDSKKKAEEQQSEINTGSPHKEDTLDALQQLSSKKYAKKNYCPAMRVVPYCH